MATGRRCSRARRAMALVALAVGVSALVPMTAAGASRPDPLRKAQRTAAADQHRLDQVQAQVAAAQARLTALAATAEKAVTRYRVALSRLQEAQQVAAVARADLAAATEQADSEQRQVDAFVRAAY